MIESDRTAHVPRTESRGNELRPLFGRISLYASLIGAFIAFPVALGVFGSLFGLTRGVEVAAFAMLGGFLLIAVMMRSISSGKTLATPSEVEIHSDRFTGKFHIDSSTPNREAPREIAFTEIERIVPLRFVGGSYYAVRTRAPMRQGPLGSYAYLTMENGSALERALTLWQSRHGTVPSS